jgi:hypothetical protein
MDRTRVTPQAAPPCPPGTWAGAVARGDGTHPRGRAPDSGPLAGPADAAEGGDGRTAALRLGWPGRPPSRRLAADRGRADVVPAVGVLGGGRVGQHADGLSPRRDERGGALGGVDGQGGGAGRCPPGRLARVAGHPAWDVAAGMAAAAGPAGHPPPTGRAWGGRTGAWGRAGSSGAWGHGAGIPCGGSPKAPRAAPPDRRAGLGGARWGATATSVGAVGAPPASRRSGGGPVPWAPGGARATRTRGVG